MARYKSYHPEPEFQAEIFAKLNTKTLSQLHKWYVIENKQRKEIRKLRLYKNIQNNIGCWNMVPDIYLVKSIGTAGTGLGSNFPTKLNYKEYSLHYN